MIRITVTDQTYDIRKALKDNKFRWISLNKSWVKIVGEGTLDKTLDDIRPPVSLSEIPGPKITVTLQSVDIHGDEMSPNEFRMKLLDVARPGVSVLEEFRKEISDIHVSPLHSSGPINPKGKQKNVDDAFF